MIDANKEQLIIQFESWYLEEFEHSDVLTRAKIDLGDVKSRQI